MRRRGFLGSAGLAGAAALGAVTGCQPQRKGAGPAAGGTNKEYYELRRYALADEAMRDRLEQFLGEVALPAWNRQGIQPVGVFRITEPAGADLYVLLPFASLDALAAVRPQLEADAAYQKAGAAVLDAPKASPAYRRMESSLLLAFDGVPKIEVPSKKASRLFQLRTYESHSDAKARKKIEMFNTGGELAIFRQVGMNPVFFGETLVGAKMPNLTYMLGFDDEDAKKTGWQKFLAHPDWKKLSGDPQYKDTVSAITNVMLQPAPVSQI